MGAGQYGTENSGRAAQAANGNDLGERVDIAPRRTLVDEAWERTLDVRSRYFKSMLIRAYKVLRAYRLEFSIWDAEDIATEALLIYATKADRIENPEAWLYKVVHDLAVDLIRSRRRECPTDPSLLVPVRNRIDVADHAIDRVNLAETIKQLSTMPEPRRIAVVMAAEGSSSEEIGKTMGTTSENARAYVSRGRRMLRLIRGSGDSKGTEK